MSSSPFVPQTVNASFTLTLAASVAADIQTHWLQQRAGSPGSLAGVMAAADTSFVFSPGSAPGSGFGFVGLAVGQTIAVDGEAMTVEAIDGETVTVARNVAPLSPPAADHAAGASIFLLKYPSPWLLIADEALRPWAQQTVTGLGAQSATFGARASGSLQVTGV
jgi:hypothetical protein